VDRYKLLAFVLSAALAGPGRSLKTLVMGFATLTDVHWSMSGEVILMSLLGGVGTFFGPVLGAGIVIALQNLLADKVGDVGDRDHRRHLRGVRAGVPQGIVGELLAWLDRREIRPLTCSRAGLPARPAYSCCRPHTAASERIFCQVVSCSLEIASRKSDSRLDLAMV
jgi:hypothetical protein